MELRATYRVAGIILSLGTAACAHPQQPDGLTAGGSSSSGSPSTGGAPTTDEPTPTTSGPLTGGDSTGLDTTASTGSGTTAVGPVCGDGDLDASEQCDLGRDNSNVGPCTLQCQDAVCGDGHVWAGVEECDAGEANSFEYGGCHPDDCTWGPRCGDGTVDAGVEECDLAELNGTGEAPEGLAACNAGCRWSGRLLFLSSKQYSGALGGVSGADLKCQGLAGAAGLTNAGKFRAWISNGGDSPLSNFEQVALTGAPYILPNGRIVAGDFPELVAMGPRTGISLTETGALVVEANAWTNTSAAGAPFSADNHCAEWTSGSELVYARVGLNAVAVEEGADWDIWRSDRLWTSLINFKCNNLAHLYCIEDAEPDAP